MEDHEAPSVDAMAEAVSFISDQLHLGRPVVVHCLAGEGRTGCVLAAFLITERHLGGEEAIRALRRAKRSFVERGQEKSVYEYAREMKL
jgi:protein-tyrosine phosphatase